MSLEDYLTIQQAARQLQISRSLLYSLKNKGEIRFKKLGRRVFIRKDDIERAMK